MPTRARQYNSIYQYPQYPYKTIRKYFHTILLCYHVYPIKMASEVGCSEDFVTDRNVQGDTLVLKKKTKAFVWKYFGFETDSNV